ncbi:MAG: TylF/MycF/NovP-related O-methyltransferase [Opitutales bacterium]
MIPLTDLTKPFEHENAFYQSCDATRMAKIIAHWDFFQRTWDIFGEFAEFGVFKGVSFLRFAMFRQLMGIPDAKKMLGFDAFGPFPETEYEEDKAHRQDFIDVAGEESIGDDQLMELLKHRQCERGVELIKGDVCKTLPDYLEKHQATKFSLVHVDVDTYEPSKAVIELCWPRLSPGGIMILDDYGRFPGETKVVDDYFEGQGIEIQRHPFTRTPAYIVKPD